MEEHFTPITMSIEHHHSYPMEEHGVGGAACVLGYMLTQTDRLFPVSLANARSVANKTDEIQMRTVSHRRDICEAIVTESWLDNNIPDATVELAGCSLFQADRTAASAKRKGRGLALYIHNS